jgi:hypothetical protein
MDADDTPSCNRCGDVYELRPGCEPTPECDSCAHIALAELRQKLREIGDVYIYPSDWHCAKEGGHPPIDAYEKIDLSALG